MGTLLAILGFILIAILLASFLTIPILIVLVPVTILLLTSTKDEKLDHPNRLGKVLSIVVVAALAISALLPIAFWGLSGLGCESTDCGQDSVLWGYILVPIVVSPFYWKAFTKLRTHKISRPTLPNIFKVLGLVFATWIAVSLLINFDATNLLFALNMDGFNSGVGDPLGFITAYCLPLIIISFLTSGPRQIRVPAISILIIGSCLLLANWFLIEGRHRIHPDEDEAITGFVSNNARADEQPNLSLVIRSGDDPIFRLDIVDPDGLTEITDPLEANDNRLITIKGRYLSESEAEEFNDRRRKVMLVESAELASGN